MNQVSSKHSCLPALGVGLVVLLAGADSYAQSPAHKSKKSAGLLLSFGYGRLLSRESEAEPDERRWHAFTLGAGIYWGSGSGQILIEFLLSNSRKLEPTRWIKKERSENFIGLMPRLRHRILSRLFANVGYGFLGQNFTGGPLGTSNDLFPVWSWGLDIELLRPPGHGLLVGFQVHNVLSKEGHEKPNWELITFHTTFVIQ